MSNHNDRETGFYWICIGGQEPEIAQWQREWDQWFVIGSELPLSDVSSAAIVVMSDLLLPPPVLAIEQILMNRDATASSRQARRQWPRD